MTLGRYELFYSKLYLVRVDMYFWYVFFAYVVPLILLAILTLSSYIKLKNSK